MSKLVEEYEYHPMGQMEGFNDIPRARCVTCGRHISKPFPTGIWEHQYDEDHPAKPADYLRLMLIINAEKNKDNFDNECVVHKKYWQLKLGLNEKELLELVYDQNDIYFNEYFRASKRENIEGFREFVENQSITHLDSQPAKPKYSFRFIRRFQNRYYKGERRDKEELAIKWNKKIEDLPKVGDVFKFGKKKYKVRNPMFWKRRISPKTTQITIDMDLI